MAMLLYSSRSRHGLVFGVGLACSKEDPEGLSDGDMVGPHVGR